MERTNCTCLHRLPNQITLVCVSLVCIVLFSFLLFYCTVWVFCIRVLSLTVTKFIFLLGLLFFSSHQPRCYFCCGVYDCASWYEKHRRSSTRVASSAGPFTTSFFSPFSSTCPCEWSGFLTPRMVWFLKTGSTGVTLFFHFNNVSFSVAETKANFETRNSRSLQWHVLLLGTIPFSFKLTEQLSNSS